MTLKNVASSMHIYFPLKQNNTREQAKIMHRGETKIIGNKTKKSGRSDQG